MISSEHKVLRYYGFRQNSTNNSIEIFATLLYRQMFRYAILLTFKISVQCIVANETDIYGKDCNAINT